MLETVPVSTRFGSVDPLAIFRQEINREPFPEGTALHSMLSFCCELPSFPPMNTPPHHFKSRDEIPQRQVTKGEDDKANDEEPSSQESTDLLKAFDAPFDPLKEDEDTKQAARTQCASPQPLEDSKADTDKIAALDRFPFKVESDPTVKSEEEQAIAELEMKDLEREEGRKQSAQGLSPPRPVVDVLDAGLGVVSSPQEYIQGSRALFGGLPDHDEYVTNPHSAGYYHDDTQQEADVAAMLTAMSHHRPGKVFLPPRPTAAAIDAKAGSDKDESYSSEDDAANDDDEVVKEEEWVPSTRAKRKSHRRLSASRPPKKRKTILMPPMRSGQETAEQIHPTADELAKATTARDHEGLKVWYQRLNELNAFKQVNGHCNVPQKFEPNPQLGIWVNKQRMEKKFLDDGKRSSMTQDRILQLEKLGFAWAKRKGDFSWNSKFDELCEYQRLHNSVDVPTKYSKNKALGRWVSTQRSQYKLWKAGQKSHMNESRYQRLVSLNFKFDMIKYPAAQEEEKEEEEDSKPAARRRPSRTKQEASA